MGTSPANFSFLIPGSATAASSETEDKNFEDSTKKLSRSHSTSILTDLKHIQRHHQDSETSTTLSTPASSLNHTGIGSTPKAEQTNNKDEETKKSKYRRTSSLKSGKTPPGTPGRQKIVR